MVFRIKFSFAMDPEPGWLAILPEERVTGSIARASVHGQTPNCIHLQPFVRVMRSAGIEVHPRYDVQAKATCRINHAEFRRVFGPTAATFYVERHNIDRSYLDPKTALFWCAACRSSLGVVHPEEAVPQTPWFLALTASQREGAHA